MVAKGVIHFAGDEAKTRPYIGSDLRSFALEGNPTGVLTENAMQLIHNKLPPPTAKSERRALRLA